MSSFLSHRRKAFRGGAGGITAFSFLSGYQDTSNATTYTYSSIDLGDADSARYIYVTFGHRSGGSGQTIASASIGGQTATIEVQQYSGSGDNCGIFSAHVPSGTTGDIVITLSGSAVRSGIGVYRVLGSPTTKDSGGDSDIASTSVNLATENNGKIIGCAVKRAVNNFTWTNIVEDSELSLEGSGASFSTASDSTDGSSVNVQCSNTGAFLHGMCCLSIY